MQMVPAHQHAHQLGRLSLKEATSYVTIHAQTCKPCLRTEPVHYYHHALPPVSKSEMIHLEIHSVIIHVTRASLCIQTVTAQHHAQKIGPLSLKGAANSVDSFVQNHNTF